MKIYVIQHMDIEGPGKILEWSQARGHEIQVVRADKGESLPEPQEVDLLILLGGTFDLNDQKLQWLEKEKAALQKIIQSEKFIFGICGGAQLLTTLLGGHVKSNLEREIGWFKLELTQEARKGIFKNLKVTEPVAYHWHSDTFDLPKKATLLASSQLTAVQAYQIGERIVAVQFHPEIDSEGIEQLIQEHHTEELLACILNHFEEKFTRP
jgi:GMP synthase-like glutamine amidotransferase